MKGKITQIRQGAGQRPPSRGPFEVRNDVMDVNTFRKSVAVDANGAVGINSRNDKRTGVGRIQFVTNNSSVVKTKKDFVTNSVVMGNTFGVFAKVVFVDGGETALT